MHSGPALAAGATMASGLTLPTGAGARPSPRDLS